MERPTGLIFTTSGTVVVCLPFHAAAWRAGAAAARLPTIGIARPRQPTPGFSAPAPWSPRQACRHRNQQNENGQEGPPVRTIRSHVACARGLGITAAGGRCPPDAS